MLILPTTYLEPTTVKCPPQLPHGTCLDCKSILNIGIFFDGTHNNVDEDKNKDGRVNAQSNVARLSELYRDDRKIGYFRHYIPGVGTPFSGIGEMGNSTFGSAFSAGGEARIIWGLLQVLNSINFFIDNEQMFTLQQMGLLASSRAYKNHEFQESPIEGGRLIEDDRLFDEISQILGTTLHFGLEGNWQNIRHKFLLQCRQILADKLQKVTAGVSGIYLDVFGFSRGAAQARVFCNWLHESLLINGKLCGVPSYVRMLGIFDTVASVSLSQTGHIAWASAKDLQVHPDIKNCLHYVALHEFRNNFPSDSVCIDGVLPKNCCEQIAPGSHSDVGGGYEPGEQGKGVRIVTPDPSTLTI